MPQAGVSRKAASAKIAVSLRLTREVVERFKSKGPGWQARMGL